MHEKNTGEILLIIYKSKTDIEYDNTFNSLFSYIYLCAINSVEGYIFLLCRITFKTLFNNFKTLRNET